jgi:hypothetical protein
MVRTMPPTAEDILTARDRFGDPPATAELAAAFRALPSVAVPEWRDLSKTLTWRWVLGDPLEGLNVPLERMPKQTGPVMLPHRVLHVDTPYWYATELDVKVPAMIHVSADDGAQVYVNEVRVPAEEGSYFPITPNVAGKVRLVVRVLNKAMYGGLNGVRITDTADYRRWREASARRERLSALVAKVRSVESPNADEAKTVLAAVRANGMESELTTAEKRLSSRPHTLFGPCLQEVGADGVTILWETDVACRPKLEWAKGYEAFQAATVKSVPGGSSGATLHTVRLTGLTPGTAYRYRLRNTPTLPESVYTFRTLPVGDVPFTFTTWADVQNAWPVFRQNVAAMRSVVPDAAFTVGVGDLVEDAYRVGPWRDLLKTLTPLAAETPAMLVPGNHDYDGCFEDLQPKHLTRYLRATPNPSYFAWTAGNARFVGLDPNSVFPTGIPKESAVYRWLIDEMNGAEWKRAKWRFIFIHQPPFAQGWEGYHGDLPIREMLEPLYEKHGIDFVVSGHAHDYERLTRQYGKQTVHFVIVGGAGGGLEDEPMSDEPKMDRVIRRHHFGVFRVAGDKVQFEAVATDTRILDRFSAEK